MVRSAKDFLIQQSWFRAVHSPLSRNLGRLWILDFLVSETLIYDFGIWEKIFIVCANYNQIDTHLLHVKTQDVIPIPKARSVLRTSNL